MSSRLSPTQPKLPPKWAIPSLELSAQRDLENARVSSKPPSRGRTIFRFVIAFSLGVAATSGWQSYGGAASEMIANWSEQFSWLGPALDAHARAVGLGHVTPQECLFPVMRPSGISAYYLCLADRR